MGQPDSKRTKQTSTKRGQVETQKQDLSGDSGRDGKPVGRGGAGRGQGRKPMGAEAATVVTLRLTPTQKQKLKALGGASWARNAIETASAIALAKSEGSAD